MGDLSPRLMIEPGTLARSPGHVHEQFPTATSALSALEQRLRAFSPAVVERWLAYERGFVVLNAARHEFVSGESLYRGRALRAAAWLKVAHFADCLRFLRPVGELILDLLGWEEEVPAGAPPAWAQFVGGVHSCFRAGLGRSPAARQAVTPYLAEGIAAYLCDRAALNRHDPSLQKLLAATLFNRGYATYPSRR